MRQILAVVACAVLVSTPAWAETFTLSPPGAMSVDLDTRNGAYSFWRIEDAGSINTIRATLQIHRLGEDPRWAPAFTVSCIGGADRIAFRIKSLDRKPPLTMHLEYMKDGKVVEEQDYLATIGLDEKIELTVTWTVDSAVSVRVGDEKRTITLGAPIRSVEIDGSTGEIELNPLAIGTTVP